MRERTEALFVVITDDNGIRLAHPTATEIGKRVSTPADRALAGFDEVSAVQSGTLGLSVRSKTPIWTPDHRRVVGEVSVGFDVGRPDRRVQPAAGRPRCCSPAARCCSARARRRC